MTKKSCIFCVVIFMLISASSILTSALVSIEKKAIVDTVIPEINNPAEFELQIKNIGSADDFEIYSLADVEITPTGTFRIKGGETKSILVRIYPFERVKKNPQYYTFVYKIKGRNSDTQEDKLTIKIASLADSFYLSADEVNPDSAYAKVTIENKENFNFTKISAVFSSPLFNQKETFPLGPYEKKQVNVTIDKDRTVGLIAGYYSLIVSINVDKVSKELNGQVKFAEKSSILTTEKKSGFIISTRVIEKTNDGNLPAVARPTVRKDIISRLFTTFEPGPNNAERRGFIVVYSWQKEILPNESFKVTVKTNWIYPLLLIIAIVIIVYLVNLYFKSSLIVKKKVKFVKTKTGTLALKISIMLSAKKFVERISVIDKIPGLMRVYEKYGEKPDRTDEKNNRVEWNIESLDTGETRIFSYIVYSKVGIVGKLELPPATAVYERNNKISEVKSNKAFFIAEPRSRIEEE